MSANKSRRSISFATFAVIVAAIVGISGLAVMIFLLNIF